MCVLSDFSAGGSFHFRTKLKQTEVDCEFLKRCCETLTEENRRLQKEVQELRALKLVSPHLYMHMSPPTTLTMCPSCERVSNANSAADRRAASSIAPAAAVCHRPIGVRPQQQSLASS
jgi:homeobox-leucine zipper protein